MGGWGRVGCGVWGREGCSQRLGAVKKRAAENLSSLIPHPGLAAHHGARQPPPAPQLHHFAWVPSPG